MVKRKRKRVPADYSSESEGVSDNDWDNKDYLDFLTNFFIESTPNNNKSNIIDLSIDDEEADPEYNVEEKEDDHDIEDLRGGRAVEISKEELIELLAEAGTVVDNDNNNTVVQKQDQSVQVVLEEETFNNHNNSLQVVVEQQQQQQQQVQQEEVLFSDRVTGIIKYQMQQHLQLLAQTYVLTATDGDESQKNLTKESKAMIVELNNLADMYGPKSTFAVSNIRHAKDLINTWPINVTSKSPIKKKILEERYMNENKVEGEEGKVFPRNVVKVISESAVFMYSELLPLCPFLRSSCKLNFTINEDALIVIGLHEMEHDKYESLNLHEKAQLINNCLLPGRPVDQIFHRIKNARKASIKEDSSINCNLKKYLIDKTLPPSPTANWTPSLLDLQPMPPTQQLKLPVSWCALIKKLKFDCNFKDYFVKTYDRKQTTPRKPKKETQQEKRSTKVKKSNNSTCSSNSPNDSSTIESSPSPNYIETERIPVLDIQGKPAAYVVIPKFCTNSPLKKPMTPSSSDVNKSTVACAEKPRESFNNNEKTVNNSNNNLKTSQVVAIPVGVPFSMPSLDSDNVDCNSALDVGVFDSPLKREIFQKATSSTATTTSSSTPSTVSNTQKNREDHSARTWIYVRKSLAELAASIENSIQKNESDPSTENEKGIEEADSSNEITEAKFEGEDEDEIICAKNKDQSSKSTDDDLENPLSPEVINLCTRDDEETDTPIKLPHNNNNKNSPVKSKSKDKKTTGNDGVATNTNVPNDKGENKGGGTSQKTSGGGGSGDGKSGNGTAKSKSSGKVEKSTTAGRQNAGSSDGRDGNDDDDQDRRRKRTHSSTLKSKEDDTDHKDDDSDDDDDSPTFSSKTSLKSEKKTEAPTSKKARKLKRSPGSNAKKRATKYNTTEMQKLLDDADSEVDIDQIQTAFAEEFWLKLQHTVDPVVYQSIVQIFVDFGDKRGPEEELFAKVGDTLKDYPDLLIDFATMVEPESPETYNFFKDNYFKENFQGQIQIRFMYLLEKLTLQCPQLKARVLQKFRYLREMDKLRESDVMEVIELYFQGNSVMTDAFKALFPTIFRPESNVRQEDFEEINLDDDTLQKSEEGTAVEVVNFPEETNIPATNSCSCECHLDTRNVSYTTKAKHCRKCCIKFQDGKVFMHSGRMMKQVNVDFTTKEKAKDILEGVACANCFETFKVPESLKSMSKKSTTGQSRIATTASRSKMQQGVDSTPPVDPKKSIISTNIKGKPTSTELPANAIVNVTTNVTASVKETVTAAVDKMDDLEEGEIVDDDDNMNYSENPKESVAKCDQQQQQQPLHTNSTTTVTAASVSLARHRESNKQEPSVTTTAPWTIDEDRVLILTCKQDATSVNTALEKVSKLIPHRTQLEINARFDELIAIIERVNAKKTDD